MPDLLAPSQGRTVFAVAALLVIVAITLTARRYRRRGQKLIAYRISLAAALVAFTSVIVALSPLGVLPTIGITAGLFVIFYWDVFRRTSR